MAVFAGSGLASSSLLSGSHGCRGDNWGEQGNVRVAMIDDAAGTCGMNL